MGKLKHVVFIGLNYQPCRSTGDKNFWLELISLLAKKLRKVSILSIRHSQQKYEDYKMNSCHITVRYYSPRFLETPDVEYRRPRIFWYKGAFPSWLGSLEKLLNIRRICNELKRLYRESPYDHVHLMDNFGLGNRVVAKNAPTAVSVSAIAYQDKHKLVYDNYLSLSYDHPNLTVVPYSSAFTKKLRQVGINKSRVVHIPWGVKLSFQKPVVENRESKILLSLPLEKPLFLWAGYIQQIQQKDFLLAIKVAKQALKKGLNGIFYFAFKPESIERNFTSFHDPKKGIFVTTTTVKEFDLLKAAADIFYSPIISQNCILAPPLTWIEVLSLGVPILTTNTKGVNEIVMNDKTGYIAMSNDQLIEKMFAMERRYQEMIPYCYDKVFTSYNIVNTVEKYLDLWGIRGL